MFYTCVMHTNSKLLFEKYARSHFMPAGKVLEIGPDVSPSNYRIIADPQNAMTWDTVDFPRNFPTTYTLKEEYHFPIDSNAYDVVLSGQVIEHVRKIWVWMQEVARVCKPGGLVITINPVSWPYHEAPIDCWRIFPEGMKALYDDAGLDVLFSTWESLEAKNFNLTIPGRSPEWQPGKVRRIFRILDKIGFPAECAFDTITVGRKRG
jgi:SAM-dependent methyltransferase